MCLKGKLLCFTSVVSNTVCQKQKCWCAKKINVASIFKYFYCNATAMYFKFDNKSWHNTQTILCVSCSCFKKKIVLQIF